MSQTPKSNSTMIASLEIVGAGTRVETWNNHLNSAEQNLWKEIEKNNVGNIIS